MSALYEIDADLLRAFALIEEAEGELTQEAADLLALDGDRFEQKAEGYVKAIRSMEADANAIKAEEAALESKRDSIASKIDRLKSRLLESLELRGASSSAGVFNLAVRESEAVQIESVDELPAEYIKATYTAKKVDIKNALKAGQSIRGASIVKNKSLQIK